MGRHLERSVWKGDIHLERSGRTWSGNDLVFVRTGPSDVKLGVSVWVNKASHGSVQLLNSGCGHSIHELVLYYQLAALAVGQQGNLHHQHRPGVQSSS